MISPRYTLYCMWTIFSRSERIEQWSLRWRRRFTKTFQWRNPKMLDTYSACGWSGTHSKRHSRSPKMIICRSCYESSTIGIQNQHRHFLWRRSEGQIRTLRDPKQWENKWGFRVSSRPDLVYAVVIVSRYMENPGKRKWEAVNHILLYLWGTPCNPKWTRSMKITCGS